ncbi:MAG: undecaprenyl-diphosphate phosphatase [Parcubacteria group bacterium]
MQYVQAVVLGAVQGLTEFIPISSDGHLFILRELMRWPDQGLLFDAVLHFGTLAAIIIVLWREVRDLFIGAWQVIRQRSLTRTPQQRLLVAVVIATLPAALAGYFLEDLFTDVYRNTLSVGLWFAATGAFYFFTEQIITTRHTRKTHQGEQKLRPTFFRALLIGLAQVMALLPGVSRSGTTIATGTLLGLSREAAARFSFVIAAPIVAGASALSLVDLIREGGSNSAEVSWGPLVLGTVAALIVGVLALKSLLRFVKRRSLRVFGAYLLTLGAIVIALRVMGIW